MECVFCAIIEKKLPANVIAETDDLIVIEDRAPKAPIHYLIIPKKHIADIQAIEKSDCCLGGKMLKMAKELSERKEKTAFRVVINNGYDAGQRVFHLHMHFLAGYIMHE